MKRMATAEREDGPHLVERVDGARGIVRVCKHQQLHFPTVRHGLLIGFFEDRVRNDVAMCVREGGRKRVLVFHGVGAVHRGARSESEIVLERVVARSDAWRENKGDGTYR